MPQKQNKNKKRKRRNNGPRNVRSEQRDNRTIALYKPRSPSKNTEALKVLLKTLKLDKKSKLSTAVRAYLRMVDDPFACDAWVPIPWHPSLMPRGPSTASFTRCLFTCLVSANKEMPVCLLAGHTKQDMNVGQMWTEARPNFLLSATGPATRVVGPCSTAANAAIGTLRFPEQTIGVGFPASSITATSITWIQDLPFQATQTDASDLHWRMSAAAMKVTPLNDIDERGGTVTWCNPRHRYQENTTVSTQDLMNNPDAAKLDLARTRVKTYIPQRHDLLFQYASDTSATEYQEGMCLAAVFTNNSSTAKSYEVEVIMGWEVAGRNTRSVGVSPHVARPEDVRHVINACNSAIEMGPHKGKVGHAAEIHAQMDSHPIVKKLEHLAGEGAEFLGLQSIARKVAPSVRTAAHYASVIGRRMLYTGEEIAPLL